MGEVQESNRICYGDLLTDEVEKRTAAIEQITASLKDAASSALREGNEAVLSFVSDHGPYIVCYAHCCPFTDIADSFNELLGWLRKHCLLEIEEMLDDDDDTSDLPERPEGQEDSEASQPLKRKKRRKGARHGRNGLTRNGSGSCGPDAMSDDVGDEAYVSSSGCSSRHVSPYQNSNSYKWKEKPCSRLVPLSDLEPLFSTSPVVCELYQRAFLAEGEVPNWVRLLSCKPEMALKLFNSWTEVMSNGPLAADHRWYIALMTASLNECEYWADRCELSFLNIGGNEELLEHGVEAVPKLAAYVDFNVHLATTPWIITADHVKDLVEGGGWTLPELVQAIVISSQMLSFCSIAKGMGCLSESEASSEVLESQCRPAQPPKEVTNMLDALNYSSDPLPGTTPLEAFSALVEEDIKEDVAPSRHCKNTARMRLISGDKVGVRFVGERSSFSNLRLSEYNWKDDASCVVDQLLSGQLASQLDDRFFTVTTMTDNDIFGSIRDIDTTRLRRMVWFYVHGLYGIVADDMDYRNINRLVGIREAGIKEMKRFIKYVGCLAGDISRETYHFDNSYAQPFSTKDKAHITLLASEARFQAALIYGMRAVAKYLASKSGTFQRTC
eukprot:TRINITY_DN30695_c0_g1_i1.p1 TRINITY_DN30695_c0_g1~~TRINITY_DN30695_c0_g1_i1.p1  ORF type:complete len:627 (+),score=218.54 TRINITY_DN30695_c0_g1_i1:44-1882(+)